ncbi:MAG: BPSS1780 family membrane protein [Betaproteobacteria bacterium]
MKLHIVPARTGILWVRLGIRTFFRQPLALSGLFFMFLAIMSLASLVPVVGLALTMALLPACTLGFMAATREADAGNFPMPLVFLSAFRAGRQQMRAMLMLGLIYGAGLWLIIGATTLVDGGKFASGYIAGTTSPVEIARDPELWVGMLTFLALQLPLSLMFWHAPALVHWHQVPPVKSLFFSLVACLRNFWAFTLFGLAWVGIMALLVQLVSLLAGPLGNAPLAGVVFVPGTLMITAMIMTSTYFTFRDCFEFTQEEKHDPTLPA